MKNKTIFLRISMILLLCITLAGCFKTDPKIISGINKLHKASSMISGHNLEHCGEKYRFYMEQWVLAKDETEKKRFYDLMQTELEYMMANKNLVETIGELKKWAEK